MEQKLNRMRLHYTVDVFSTASSPIEALKCACKSRALLIYFSCALLQCDTSLVSFSNGIIHHTSLVTDSYDGCVDA